MIRKKDVIRMKVPFPNISSKLAFSPHMYICRNQADSRYEYIKCQTLKPYMLIKNPITNYHDEDPDSSRNPFYKKTRIDCDKVFTSSNVSYSDSLKTTIRSDVCDDLFNRVEEMLQKDDYDEIPLNERDLKNLNDLIY